MTILDRRSLMLGAGASLALAGCDRAGPDSAPIDTTQPAKVTRLLAAARR